MQTIERYELNAAWCGIETRQDLGAGVTLVPDQKFCFPVA